MANQDAVGTEGPAFPMEVERGKVREFARACGSKDPTYWEDDAPVPPTFLITNGFWAPPDAGRLMGALGIDLRRLLHGAQEFEFFGPPPEAGTTLTVQTSIESVEEKEGRRGGTMTIAVMVTDFTDEAGALRARARNTAIETGRPPT